MPLEAPDSDSPEFVSDRKHHESKQSYLVRLFKGDVRLVITFWVWGLLIGPLITSLPYILDALGAYVLSKFDMSLELLQLTDVWLRSAILFGFVFGLAYTIFIWIAIWRSAGKYQGRYWGTAARVCVVLSIASMLLDLFLPTEYPS